MSRQIMLPLSSLRSRVSSCAKLSVLGSTMFSTETRGVQGFGLVSASSYLVISSPGSSIFIRSVVLLLRVFVLI